MSSANASFHSKLRIFFLCLNLGKIYVRKKKYRTTPFLFLYTDQAADHPKFMPTFYTSYKKRDFIDHGMFG